MPTLSDLANKYGSDKGTEGPSRHWPAHNYTDIYEAYLGGWHDDPITVLEVGLGIPGDLWDAQVAHGRNAIGGASLKMWYDYFPNAAIYGADIHDASYLDNDRIKTFVIDQGKRQQLVDMAKKIGKQFDVIVDDGSHRPDHQQITFGALFPYLKPGGVYFIEDLMNNGKGDADAGRFTSNDVLNTRRLFRRFANEGAFPTPHLIGDDAAMLGEAVQRVAFHRPSAEVTATIGIGLHSHAAAPRTVLRPAATYQPNSEALVAIRKKR